MINFYRFLCLLTFLALTDLSFSQTVKPDTLTKVIAGPEYKASAFKRWLWGSNYRDDWTRPVSIKTLWIDTINDETRIIAPANGTGYFYVQNVQGGKFLARPVNKTLGKNLPEIFRNTFIEHRLKDAASTSQPYAGAPIPMLSEKANIYSTNVTYLYVPQQPALTQRNIVNENKLYLFEEVVPGNFESFVQTNQLLDSLAFNSNCSIDEKAFIKARLFDMFINDWDKREENWLWGKTKSGDKTVYVPLPINRDQAFSDHDGVLLNRVVYAAGFKYMQKFNSNILGIRNFNYQQRNLDRRLLNQSTLKDWQTAAKELQQSLTNKVIEDAVKQFPPEIYAQTGKKVSTILKERRKHITEWATKYYYFISKEVEIPGTYNSETFNVQQLSSRRTLVQVYNAKNDGKPFYSRSFKASETNEIRLFGLTGADKYRITGTSDNKIRLKIIDGLNSDSIIVPANKKNNNLVVYAKDSINTNNKRNVHIINDTFFRSYRYNWFNYDSKGFVPSIFYTNEDRLFIGLGYKIRHYRWGKIPFAYNQLLDLHYSLLENAFSITYKALFPNPVLRSNLSLLANYDDVRWSFYFGLGNDTKFDKNYDLKYYTARTRQWIFQPQLTRSFGRSTVSVYADIQGIKVINDSTRFITKPSVNTTGYDWETYAGAGLSYSFQKFDDPLVPVKGFYINAAASGEQNLYDRSSHYIRYSGTAHLYIPLTSKFSINVRTGAATVTGNPEFYQYASIGGTIFRGVARDRFRGKTAFFNTNDLRFISPFRSYFFNGKAGFLAFVDNGRVWLPGETSNTWHIAYGGGILVAPFNFLYADATYGRCKRESTVQVRITLLSQR